MKLLARLLSINLLLSLVLVIGYVALFCWSALMIWVAGYKVGTFLFVLVIAFVTRSKAAALFEDAKQMRASRLSKK
jgi:hypothetical protein